MRFNNLLNKLGIKNIGILLVSVIILFIALIYFVIRTLFHVTPPELEFKAYIADLQNQNFNSALSHVKSEDYAFWKENFQNYAQDESATRALQFFLWEHTKVEHVSTSIVGSDESAARFIIHAPDALALLQEARRMAEDGQIDMSDPAVVRIGLDSESSLIYYIIDHYEDIKKQDKSAEVIINFIKEGKLIDQEWKLSPTEDLHDKLDGQLKTAIDAVLDSPLVLPKS